MFHSPGFQFDLDQNKRQSNSDSSIKSLIRDFFTKPIPLPIWLWNIIVIIIYIQITIFIVQWSLAAILAIVFRLTGS